MGLDFKLPDTPVIIAGGVGGPAVMYSMTPARNALTLGATNKAASAGELYGQVFARGISRGWVGGVYPAMAACPQFLCLGPAYHFYASFAGVSGGVVLTGLTESLVVYGAETCNAQVAKNQRNPGTVANVHPSYKPFGPGFGCHVARNIIASAGLRMFCNPCISAIESVSGASNGLTQLAGDFAGNVISACLSAPIHQMYGFTVTTPELQQMSGPAKRARILSFLKDQYLDTTSGKTRLSSVFFRDMFMRSMYIGVASTMYLAFERGLVGIWPQISAHHLNPLALSPATQELRAM